MRTTEEIKRDIDLADKEIIRGCYSPGSVDTISLRKNREQLENELTLASSILVACDDELDIFELYKCRDLYIYYIVLHDTPSKVGYIGVDYSDGSHVIGNVGYEVFRKYRGHGYEKNH